MDDILLKIEKLSNNKVKIISEYEKENELEFIDQDILNIHRNSTPNAFGYINQKIKIIILSTNKKMK